MGQLLSVSTQTASTLADLYGPIADDLDEVEKILAQTLNSPSPAIGELLQHVSHYRGKRLRPALLLLVGQACGRLTAAHHVLASVIEMIHTATLIHDNVLDGASLRRHVATVHASWGTQTSILLGDYLFSHAYNLSATLNDPAACRLISETTNRVCTGELRQVLERGNLNLSEAEYLDIIDGKTAALIACCCRLARWLPGRLLKRRRPWHATAVAWAWRFRLPTTCSTCLVKKASRGSHWAPTWSSKN